MNPNHWTYLTADRVKMHTWTRKRRLKFRKRWRKQHNGENFRWFGVEWKFFIIPDGGEIKPTIFHMRESPLGMKIKEG